MKTQQTPDNTDHEIRYTETPYPDPAPQDQDQRLADAIAGLVACTDPDASAQSPCEGNGPEWIREAPRKPDPASHSPRPWTEKDWSREALRLSNRLIEVEAHAQRLADALSISTTTLETVFASDPKNIAAKCCIERNRKELAQWEQDKQ